MWHRPCDLSAQTTFARSHCQLRAQRAHNKSYMCVVISVQQLLLRSELNGSGGGCAESLCKLNRPKLRRDLLQSHVV